MSQRRISRIRRYSHLRRSSSGPGELNEDSEIFETDDPLWFKRLEGNNTRLGSSFQLSNAEESTAILDSNTEQSPMGPPQPDWYKALDKFNRTVQNSPKTRRSIRRSINTKFSTEDSISNEYSLDSEPDKNSRKRKKRLHLGSQTTETLGGSAFFNALNDSATTIISDPGPSKMRKSLPKSSYFSDEDSFKSIENPKSSGQNKTSDETGRLRASEARKSRPTLFKKFLAPPRESTENVFENILDNVSSSIESTTAADNENEYSTQSLKVPQKSDLSIIKESEPSHESNSTLSQTRKSKNFEQSHNPDQNSSQEQRKSRSRSKTADTSISPNSKEQKSDSTFESNTSDVGLQKKRSSLLRANRRNEEESTLNNSRNVKKQNELNSSKSRNNSRLIPVVGVDNLGNEIKATVSDSDTESEIDVEYKNDDSPKNTEEQSLKSKSKRRKKSIRDISIAVDVQEKASHNHSVVSENRSRHTVNTIFDSDSDISENEDLRTHKTTGTVQNVDHSGRGSRLNRSVNSHEKPSTSNQLTILPEEPLFESTRKLDVQKSRKSQKAGEAIASIPGEQKNNSTSESDISVQKKTPRLFRNKRKSMARNAFENAFSSEDESTLNKSSGKNSSAMSLEKRKDRKVEGQNTLNKSKLSSTAESNDFGSRLRVSDSDTEIDVEDKNDEDVKSSKEESPYSMSKRIRESVQATQIGNGSQVKSHNKSLLSESRSEQTVNNIPGSDEEEELISIGTQEIENQSNQNDALDTSKNQNSNFHKSKGTLLKDDHSRRNSRLNRSANDRETSKQLSILIGTPQYESTRKLDIQKLRKSQRETESRGISRLDNAENNENYPDNVVGSQSTEELSEELLTGETANEEEKSNLNIEVSDPTVDNISANRSNSSNLKKRKTKSNLDRSENNQNLSEISEQSSGNMTDSRNQKKRSDASERSQTISLSEGQSIEDEMQNDKSLSIKNTSKNRKQNMKTSFRRSYQKNSSDSNDTESLQEDDLLKTQPAKPSIVRCEVLNPNNIDLRKLKGNKVVSQTEDKGENTLNSEKNNSSKILKTSVIRDISASTRVQHSTLFPKDTRMSTVEAEFHRLHAETNLDISSTSHKLSQNIDNKKSKEVSRKQISDSSLLKTLEDDDESEISENPLLIYTHNLDEVEFDAEKGKSTQQSQLKNSSPAKIDNRGSKQKMIDNFFKPRDRRKSEKKPRQFDPSQGPTFSQIVGDKDKLAEVKQKITAMTANLRDELFKPKVSEPPKKKFIIPKGVINRKRKDAKPVNPAYLVNGVVYKQPRLPRPQPWATDRLYKYIWKRIEPKYQLATRVRSEKFILRLGAVVKKVTRVSQYKNYEEDLENLMKEMARLGLIVHRKDFNDFCIEFLPYSFRVKATPILLPGNKMSIPYDPDKLYTPLI